MALIPSCPVGEIWEDEGQMFVKSYASSFQHYVKGGTVSAVLIEHNSVICMEEGEGKGHFGERFWVGLIKGHILINQSGKWQH